MITNMRLSQLARKLNISQAEINGFLKRRGINHKGGGNTKMAEDHVALVIEYFEPELLEKAENIEEPVSKEADQKIQEEQEITEVLEEEKEELVPEAPGEKDKPIPETQANDTVVEVEEVEEIEVIRAPKIQLEGLRVVGKIDLQEKEKKVDKIKPAEEVKKETVKVDKKNENNKPPSNKHGRKRGKNLNYNKVRGKPREEAYEDKLKRLEREKSRTHKEHQKKIHEKKKQYYLKTVQKKQVSIPKPKTVKKQSENITSDTVVKNRKKTNKNLFGRLWSWLNGEYDNF